MTKLFNKTGITGSIIIICTLIIALFLIIIIPNINSESPNLSQVSTPPVTTSSEPFSLVSVNPPIVLANLDDEKIITIVKTLVEQPFFKNIIGLDNRNSTNFHNIPQELVNYLGQNEFYNWIVTSVESKENGTYKTSILSFIHDHDIPKNTFENIINTTKLFYTTDYNAEVLYSGEVDKVINYYNSYHKNQEKILTKNFLFDLKSSLRDHIIINKVKASEFATFVNTKTTNDFYLAIEAIKGSVENYSQQDLRHWSIPEIVEKFDITKTEFIQILEPIKANFPNINFDVDSMYAKTFSQHQEHANKISDKTSTKNPTRDIVDPSLIDDLFISKSVTNFILAN